MKKIIVVYDEGVLFLIYFHINAQFVVFAPKDGAIQLGFVLALFLAQTNLTQSVAFFVNKIRDAKKRRQRF